MRREKQPKTRGGKTAQMVGDVCDHMDDLRRYYFDIASADESEVMVRVRREETERPVGFRPRPR